MLQPIFRRSVASLCLFYRYFHGECATSVSDLVPPIRMFGREIRISASSHPYTLDLLRCRTRSHFNSFCPRSASLWNSLPGACFPPSYNLDCFKRNINSYLQLPWIIFILNIFLLVAPYQEWLFGANLHFVKKLNSTQKMHWRCAHWLHTLSLQSIKLFGAGFFSFFMFTWNFVNSNSLGFFLFALSIFYLFIHFFLWEVQFNYPSLL